MDAFELRARSQEEADELGPEPTSPHDLSMWREERRGAVALLAALANYEAALLRRAALSVAEELADDLSRQLLLDAADVHRGVS